MVDATAELAAKHKMESEALAKKIAAANEEGNKKLQATHEKELAEFDTNAAEKVKNANSDEISEVKM